MNHYEIVKRLIGEIRPVGESHTDNKRYDNLEEMLTLTESLLYEIQDAAQYRNRPEYSMSLIGERAYQFILILKRMVENE